jgi:glucuronyl esterase-like protein
MLIGDRPNRETQLRITLFAIACLALASCAAPPEPAPSPSELAARWAAQPATNTDETKVGAYTLPDLMKTQNGAAVKTVADWEGKRRPEIMKLLADYQEGVTPSKSIKPIFEIVERDGIGMGGLAKRRQVRIKFAENPDVQIRVLLYTPAKAKGPVPTLLHLSFSPNVLLFDEPGLDEGMAWSAALKARVPDREATKVGGFDARSFVERGYGVAIVYYGDIYPDFDHGNAYGVPSLFGPAPRVRAPSEWGANGAWAWGLSRVADYLVTDPAVDRNKLALSGVSRLGKAVLWAGAQDRRFAVVIPLLSGEGGASTSRRFYGETIADLTNPARYPYWFAPRYQDYAFKVNELPVDGHMLLAMIAPRPVLQIVGTKDTWSDPKGEYVSAKAAESVWKLYSKRTALGDYPAPDKPVLAGMGFLLHEGEHTTLAIDFRTMADFMDLHFGKPKQ